MRTWETQVEMIRALGKIGYKPILADLEELLEKQNTNSVNVITHAAIAYVRIKRTNPNDALPVIELLHTNNWDVAGGALYALCFDDMIPLDEQIKQILDWVKGKEKELDERFAKGAIDRRLILLSAASHWDRKNPVVDSFIEDCLANEKLNTVNGFLEKIEKIKKGKRLFSE
jgi:hypothetical protein